MTLDANNPAIEDDDLDTTAPDPIDDELSTTAPNPPDEDVWKMPEPVFRRTSGKLPEQFEKQIAESSSEPQTDMSDIPPTSDTYVPPKPTSGVLKMIVVGLALAAMIAFLIVFLSVVYFVFLR
jgi:hypothetical protein